MKKFFAPNIDRAGRIVRAIVGLAMIIGGLLLSPQGYGVCTLLVLGGGFALYEASRGWCIMRACGIRTRL
jgi:hypothetical protein